MSAGIRLGDRACGTTTCSTTCSPARAPTRPEAGLSFCTPERRFWPGRTCRFSTGRRQEPLGVLLGGIFRPGCAAAAGPDPLYRRMSGPRPAAGDQLRQGLLDIYKARGSDYPAAVRMAGYLQAALGLLMAEGPRPGRRGPEPLCPPGRRLSPAQLFPQRGGGGDRRTCGVSRSCLYRAFQAEFRCSPSDYLTRFRIQRACQLLCHSTLSVSAVAVSAGFADPFYFSRAFRREVGCSPSAYRTQKTGGAESPDNKEDPV